MSMPDLSVFDTMSMLAVVLRGGQLPVLVDVVGPLGGALQVGNLPQEPDVYVFHGSVLLFRRQFSRSGRKKVAHAAGVGQNVGA